MDLCLGESTRSLHALARGQRVFVATANVTTPGVYTSGTGIGGPLLWNNTGISNERRYALILAVGVGITTASGAASVLGLTGAGGQASAPTSTTAIDAVGCTYVGAGGPLMNTYRIGTTTNAGSFFMPTHSLDTAALTAIPTAVQWTPIDGGILVPVGSWTAVAAGVVATSAVLQIGLMWAEVPY